MGEITSYDEVSVQLWAIFPFSVKAECKKIKFQESFPIYPLLLSYFSQLTPNSKKSLSGTPFQPKANGESKIKSSKLAAKVRQGDLG